MVSDTGELCPQCGRLPKRGKWVCQCGTVLNLDVLRHEKPADRLPGNYDEQAEASDAQHTPTNELGAQDQPTLKFDPVHGLSEIFMGRVSPIQVPEVDIFSLDLSPMDLYLYSKIDGKFSATELTGVTGLKQVELGVVLLTLMRTGAVTTTQKVSIETVAGRGAKWGDDKTDQIRKVTADNARKQYEMFRARRDSGDINGATLHLKRAVATVQNEDYITKLEEHLATAAKWCDELYKEARSMLAQGRTGSAVEALKKGVARFPSEAGFYNLLAIAIVAHNKDRDLAAAYLRRAGELDPTNPVYAQNLHKLQSASKKRARKAAAAAAAAAAKKRDLGFFGKLRRMFRRAR